ncbi:MAG: glutathione peroxidase [Candidatus Zophobacter franzmannii]|jgi:glutathione peroxidase|nr:glutathione peroxidase [Candidatus Zophobacter franzmannii]
MRYFLIVLILLGVMMSLSAESIYDFTMKNIDGEDVKLDAYEGKLVMIVNTASKCGFTGQFEGLQKLYQEYEEKGLVILGFPANNFMKQEPGNSEEIKNFCTLNYGVTFPMFEKISVKGKKIHPLYEYLTSKETNPEFAGKISWNFNKFLVSKDGVIINRFKTATTPNDEKVVNAIEKALE